MVKFRTLFFVLCLGLIGMQSAFATVNAAVDQRDIEMGDTIKLTISGSNMEKNAVPDLSEVIDNFDLRSSSQTQSVTMINGKMTNEIVWIFTLLPKHGGNVVIPAINVGNERSQPLTIHVKGSENTSTTTADDTRDTTTAVATRPDVFVKAELSPANPYVQSQALYKIRLFYNRQLANPQLAEPTASGIDFVRLGQSKTYQKEINNQPYQVVELNYAAFPKRSGTLNIPGPMFMGSILTDNVNNFMTPNTVKPVKVMANSLQMQVQAIPASVSAKKWLPAAEVKLTESWSADPSKFKVGVPITRTVKITAKGVDEKQLPQLLPTDVTGFQVYPDKPEVSADTDGKSVFATRIEKSAYMPTQDGIAEIPAVTVHWWNTQTNKEQTATIPASTINIAAGEGASTNTPITLAAPAVTTKIDAPSKAATTNTEPLTWRSRLITWIENNRWFDAVIICPWILLLISFAYFWQRDKKQVRHAYGNSTQEMEQIVKKESLRQARQRVEVAIKAHDPQQFAAALINLACCCWDDTTILSLSDVAAKCRTEKAKQAIQELDKLRYSYTSGLWQAEQTWKIIENEFMANSRNSGIQKEGLPELYPSAR